MSIPTRRHELVTGSVDWVTPKPLLKALGPFDLDPCAASVMPWRTARRMVAPPRDGLAVEWQGRVWLNPPYGPRMRPWMERMAKHGHGIALVFTRTDTRWFNWWVWPYARALLFLRRRVSFAFTTGVIRQGSVGPSCLVAYSQADALALANAELPGTLVTVKKIFSQDYGRPLPLTYGHRRHLQKS